MKKEETEVRDTFFVVTTCILFDFKKKLFPLAHLLKKFNPTLIQCYQYKFLLTL